MDAIARFALIALFLIAGPALARSEAAVSYMVADPKPTPVREPKVQIAILLDNSGSMQGLINQARAQIWKVVTTFAQAKRDGKRPRLELALYEYGDGVRKLSGFTSDLDAISEQLFALGIRGGTEPCGEVIAASTKELEWSGNPDDLKLIYIAGNEPFTQGSVDYRTAIANAQKKGIQVNVIHCGGDEPTWRAGALAARGDFLMIDHNARIAQIVAPQDQELVRLNQELNKTYLGYGRGGRAAKDRQKREDANAAAMAPSAVATRAAAKSTALYDNSTWDIVDGTRSGAVKLEAMPAEEMPEELRGKSDAEQKAEIEKLATARATIQKKIQALTAERDQYVAEKQKEAGAEASLDKALIQSARSQAEAKAFSF